VVQRVRRATGPRGDHAMAGYPIRSRRKADPAVTAASVAAAARRPPAGGL